MFILYFTNTVASMLYIYQSNVCQSDCEIRNVHFYKKKSYDSELEYMYSRCSFINGELIQIYLKLIKYI